MYVCRFYAKDQNLIKSVNKPNQNERKYVTLGKVMLRPNII